MNDRLNVIQTLYGNFIYFSEFLPEIWLEDKFKFKNHRRKPTLLATPLPAFKRVNFVINRAHTV